jgi:choline kinase
MDAKDGLGKGPGSINEFLLDSRTPGGVSSLSLGDSAIGGNYAEEEKARERETERQVDALLKEVKIWRVANSAQWVAWGIVQAKVPELDEQPPTADNNKPVLKDSAELPNGKENQNQKGVDKRPEGLVAEGLLNGDTPKEAEQLEDEEDEFDYLGYAQERARFFWGDVVALGLVEKEELPESLVKKLKTVEY